MSIVVEHEKRRKEILEKALDVFVNEGYESTTFQKIADHCGITRTTLYIYFKNKKDIFDFSAKQLLAKVHTSIKIICADTSLNSIDRIIKVLLDIFRQLEENRRLLLVTREYLMYFSTSTKDPERRIRRRTLKMRHIMASLIIDGIKSGELKVTQVKAVNEYLYSLIEAAIFRLVVLQKQTVGDLSKTAIFAVRQISAA